MAPPAGADIEHPDCVAAGVGGPWVSALARPAAAAIPGVGAGGAELMQLPDWGGRRPGSRVALDRFCPRRRSPRPVLALQPARGFPRLRLGSALPVPGVVVLVRAIHTTKEAPVATSNINRVVLTGNLTADPELRSLPSGTSVCRLRLAVNTRRKDSATGEYVDAAVNTAAARSAQRAQARIDDSLTQDNPPTSPRARRGKGMRGQRGWSGKDLGQDAYHDQRTNQQGHPGERVLHVPSARVVVGAHEPLLSSCVKRERTAGHQLDQADENARVVGVATARRDLASVCPCACSAVPDLAAVVREDVGDQAVHLDARRRGCRRSGYPVFVDLCAPHQHVEPHVVVQVHEVGLEQFGEPLLELGDRGRADLEQVLDVGGVDLGAVDLENRHDALLGSVGLPSPSLETGRSGRVT
jgi:single-stranded DNA-binding protein